LEPLSAEAARTAHFLPRVERGVRETDRARDWNVKASGAGFVTKFAVSGDYLKGFDVHVVGGFQHAEYWIPAEQLDEFNQNILVK
jgi:hypothetical protein